MTQGELLRHLRRRMGLTQIGLSELAKVSQSMISAVECHHRVLSGKWAKRMARALGVKPALFRAPETYQGEQTACQNEQ